MEIEREVLLGLVKDVWAAADSAALLFAFTCVYIEMEDGNITVAASDMETYAASGAQVGQQDTGAESVLVPARPFQEILKKGTGETVTITPKDRRIGVVVGKFRASLPTVEAEDFPGRPELPEGISWAPADTEVLGCAIKRVVFAVAKEGERDSPSGVRVEAAADGGLVVVATDGHRMAILELPESGLAVPGDGVQVPVRGCQLLVQLLQAGEAASNAITTQAVI